MNQSFEMESKLTKKKMCVYMCTNQSIFKCFPTNRSIYSVQLTINDSNLFRNKNFILVLKVLNMALITDNVHWNIHIKIHLIEFWLRSIWFSLEFHLDVLQFTGFIFIFFFIFCWLRYLYERSVSVSPGHYYSKHIILNCAHLTRSSFSIHHHHLSCQSTNKYFYVERIFPIKHGLM